ncbi:MerR family transcriptional regulator, partial [Neisseria meningitidis]
MMLESVCFISIVFPLNSLTKLPYLSNIATVYTLELTLRQVFFTV